MGIYKKKITEIVDDNYINASVLYYFGISFFDYSEKTLEQACKERGLDVKSVINKLESVTQVNTEKKLALYEFPIDLIIEYLKHSHYIFIKQKLPYLAKLIKTLDARDSRLTNLESDLKIVFPLFVEDFIHHIYEEEDTLFRYILLLNKHKSNPAKIYYDLEKHSIQKYALEHDHHDDEMQGIRKIANQYDVTKETPLHVRVIFAELESFENDLRTHAKIENEILFPKALVLEKQVKDKFNSTIALN